MPLVVTFLAIRAHLGMSGKGGRSVLWAFLKNPTERRRLFRSGLKDFGRVFIVACVLDTTYQLLGLAGVLPGRVADRGGGVRHRAVFSDPRPGHCASGSLLYRKWARPADAVLEADNQGLCLATDTDH